MKKVIRLLTGSLGLVLLGGAAAAEDTAIAERLEGIGLSRPAAFSDFPLNFGATIDMVMTMPVEERNDTDFEIRSFEINIGGPVDPYFDALVTVAWEDGDAELEEAWVSAILPYGFRAVVGRSFIPFGSLNQIHVHDYPQVDVPFVLDGLTTDHGMIGDGGHLEYLLPFESPTLNLFAGVYDRIQHSIGRRIEGFPVIVRAESFAQWDDGAHAVLGGISYLNSFGDKDLMEGRNPADPRARGKIDQAFGVDLKYRWNEGSVTGRGVTLGGEYLFFDYERYDAHAINDPSSEVFVPGADPGSDNGFYLYGQWDFDRFWGVGYRYDRSDILFSSLESDSKITGHSIYGQWHPTEFSRLRLQYQYRERGNEDEHIVFLQGTFTLGWHPPHRF